MHHGCGVGGVRPLKFQDETQAMLAEQRAREVGAKDDRGLDAPVLHGCVSLALSHLADQELCVGLERVGNDLPGAQAAHDTGILIDDGQANGSPRAAQQKGEQGDHEDRNDKDQAKCAVIAAELVDNAAGDHPCACDIHAVTSVCPLCPLA